MSSRAVRILVAGGAAAIALAACGPTPPQAPFQYAKKLDSATSGISTDCGLAYQVTAFPGDHRKDLATLEATAGTSVRKLAKVWKRNPDWIYQGETIRQIVGASLSYLDSCGLHNARAELARLTARR
jgi:hypothetical protein